MFTHAYHICEIVLIFYVHASYMYIGVELGGKRDVPLAELLRGGSSTPLPMKIWPS